MVQTFRLGAIKQDPTFRIKKAVSTRNEKSVTPHIFYYSAVLIHMDSGLNQVTGGANGYGYRAGYEKI